MYGENFKLQDPGVMPDDVIKDSVPFMDKGHCKDHGHCLFHVIYISKVYRKSFGDKLVFNIPMHEIDVRKLHNNILSKYSHTTGNWG